jgi:hypothetical protein
MHDARSTSPNSILQLSKPPPTELRRAAALAGEVKPTRPSIMVRLTIKPMSRVLNPLVRKVAGKKYMAMAAQVHHLGRRSGRAYMTPVGAKLSGVYFLIPLTFGNQSDWCRNIQAARGGRIRCMGIDYEVVEPELLDAGAAKAEIRSTFSWSDRVFIRLMGIKQFLRLRVALPDHRRA